VLFSHKNKEGFIYSYFEFDIVDKEGNYKEDGEYMYVRDLWVHKDYSGEKEIKQFITEAERLKETGSVKYIYWLRSKYKDKQLISKRLSKTFCRTTCLNHKEN
jgi:hypothetical protein